MTFTVQINCDNAAFKGEGEAPHTGEECEIRRILKDVIDRIDIVPVTYPWLGEGLILKDINGNRCGVARFVDSEG